MQLVLMKMNIVFIATRQYDCLMGISGGLNFDYLAYLGYTWGVGYLLYAWTIGRYESYKGKP